MSRFARVGEEVFLRYQELIGEDKRGNKGKFASKETLFLHLLILLNTFTESGICKKTIWEICQTYNLDYDNSIRRYKILRKKQWCENTKQGIRPLVGVKTVNITEQPKTVNSTVENDEKTVNSTVQNCKDYSKPDEKTVNFTVSDAPIYKEFKEPFKDQNFSDTTTANSNGHKSKFSIEECLRYVESRIAKGEPIDTPHRFAKWLYQSGNDDVFIQATLYPEQTAQIETEAEIESPAPDASPALLDALKLIRQCSDSGEDYEYFEKWYSPDEWAWLMEQIR